MKKKIGMVGLSTVIGWSVALGAAEKVRTFGPGVHYLTETQVFTAADSGTVWKAAPGAKPVLSGARKVTGWRKAAGGLWSADVPWVTGRENGFRQLTVNGALLRRLGHLSGRGFLGAPHREQHRLRHEVRAVPSALRTQQHGPQQHLRRRRSSGSVRSTFRRSVRAERRTANAVE